MESGVKVGRRPVRNPDYDEFSQNLYRSGRRLALVHESQRPVRI
jgi:hypothetical protein